MNINTRIKALREHTKLTQSNFAKKIAISASYLGEMENGTKKVNERIIRLIITEFNVDEEWLRNGNGTMFKQGSNILLPRISRIIESLSPRTQEYVLAQLELLVEYSDVLSEKTK